MSLRRIALLAAVAVLPAIAALAPSGFPPASSATDPGTIAYFRRSTDEIRLIRPDGTNDRRLWTAPTANSLLGIVHLEWRPDGGALAFSSDQEDLCSVYDSDVYAILNNGTGLRRVTNSPACAELAGYAKGTVQVTVPNFGGLVGVYVQGAPGPRTITGYGTVTFADVADFGPGVLQPVVGIWGIFRRLAPAVDVKAGQTVSVSLVDPSIGVPDYGTGDLSWRSDGSQIGYAMRNGGDVYGISANPPLGSVGQTLPTAANTLSSLVAWGPASKPDQFLYYAGYGSLDAEGIYINSTTATGGGTQLVSRSSIFQQFGHGDPPFYFGYEAPTVHDLKWLPDGSGFLLTMTYVYVNLDDPDRACLGTCSDVFEYRFTSSTTGTLTQVTRLAAATGAAEDNTARSLSISPDGQQVAIERVTEELTNPASSVWVVGRDGSGLRKLVDNAWSPAWGVTAPLAPTPTETSTPTSTPTQTPVASNTPTPTRTPMPDQNGLSPAIYMPVVLPR